MIIGVAGAGKMGGEIFRLLAKSDIDVTLYGRDPARLVEHEQKYLKDLRRSLRRGTMTEEQAEARRKCVRVTSKPDDLAHADIVIEAITEDLDAKSAFFREIEDIIRPEAALASNTSSLSIEKLAGNLRNPERFCGLHYFSPVALISLVEIISWRGSSKTMLKSVADFCRHVSRKPIIVRDGPGSTINSILAYYYTEALYLLEEGQALPSKIDELARTFCSLGPCESADTVGLDLFIKGLRNTTSLDGIFSIGRQAESARVLTREECAGRGGFHVPYLFRTLLEQNRLGRKTSAGLYLYKNDHPVDDDPSFYVDKAAGQPAEKQSDEVIARRLLYSVLNGVLYCWHARTASRENLDTGMKEVLLMEKGPFELMDGLGEERVRQEFNMLAESVGARFRHKSGWLSWH